MGCDATNYLPKDTSEKDVEAFLRLLGFDNLHIDKLENGAPIRTLWHYDELDYERFQGISASCYRADEYLEVGTRTLVWRNKKDCDIHNETVRKLRRQFGGHYVSDLGRNRLFKWEGVNRVGAEAGCYRAYWRFKNNYTNARRFLNESGFESDMADIPELRHYDLRYLSNNLLIPYLVSIFEEFLRSCFVALIRHSPNRVSIISGWRIEADRVLDDDGNQQLIEYVIAQQVSFQHMGKSHKAFQAVSKNIDLCGSLSKPYRRRKELLLESTEALIRCRHKLVHRAELDLDLDEATMKRRTHDVGAAARRFFEHLIDLHNWHPNDHD